MTVIEALGPGGAYRNRKRELITDVAGDPIAEMTIAPGLYVARTVNVQRMVRPLPVEERDAALVRAAKMFLSDEIAGLEFDSYVELTSRVSGLPIGVARAGAHSVAGQVAVELEIAGGSTGAAAFLGALAERSVAVASFERVTLPLDELIQRLVARSAEACHA